MEGSSQTRFSTDVTPGEALSVKRFFTTPGQHAFDTVQWETRDARIAHGDRVAFEQRDVEFPRTWSQNATNIVAQKYFRGQLGSAVREHSVRQMIGRVAGTIADWGRTRGYFASVQDGDAFESELAYILVHQMAAFNSPVWFNVGFEESPQCSACMPYRALISTPDGMVQIGELVEGDQIGREVYDAHGVTRIVATQANGVKPVHRVRLRNGSFVDATADHVVKAVRERRTEPQWLRVDQLEVGMRMHLHPHRAKLAERALVAAGADATADDAATVDAVKLSEAALAGWLQADGFVGQYGHGTNRSLTIEFLVVNDEERAWVERQLDVALPDVHRHVRDADTLGTPVQRIRLYGEVLGDFVERWNLLARGIDMTVPFQLWTASHEEIAAYLRSVFQADGYVSVRRENGCESAKVGFAVIGERWTEDIQILLGVLGIYSRRTHKAERRSDRQDMHEVVISIGSERARFAELVGFVDARKQGKLLASLDLRNPKRCPDLREEEIVAIEPLGAMDVYDIQTESGEYLCNNVAVHNCFILSVQDTMESILDWNTKEGKIFLGGSGSGINLSNIRGSMEPLSKGGTASGPVSFMRGADSWAGTIKSGGKTRRAAKMVVLDVDHPDIREFIWCKAREEKKANALRDAGFDMSIDGDGFTSIQYQNANNSVRLSDDFMRAAENDEDWHLIARSTGQPVGDPIPARELLREIAEAAWLCADPGVQYDTTINRWHTCPVSGRINASNPCCFVGETLVNTTDGPIAIAELVRRADANARLPHVACATSSGDPVHAPISRAFSSGLTTQLCRVVTEHGERFSCTPEHRFMAIDGEWVQARDLAGRSVRSLVDEGLETGGRVARQVTLTTTETLIVRVEVEEVQPTEVYDLEIAGHHNFAVVGGIDGAALVAHNSEYMHVDDSACNLASLNLMKFRRADGSFDVTSFEHCVDIMFLAQEILVGPSSYPTEQIGVNARAFRQLGLGYANLGAFLMSNGMAYDSDAGRATAAAITSLMTGRAYLESARVAAAIGPYERYAENRDAHNAVMRMHRDAASSIPDASCSDTALLTAARSVWDDAVAAGEAHGYRNAQATVLAPTGCLVDGSLVSTSRGLVRLRSLGDVDGARWQDLDVQVATDEGPRPATKFYVNGMEQVVCVETARGYRLQGTPTHRIKVVDHDGNWVWKRMAEVTSGDRVPMMLNSLIGEPQQVVLPPLGDLHWNAGRHTRVPRAMNPELAEFVGYFMGDGSLHARGLRLCVADADDDVVERLVYLARELFGLEAHVLPCDGYIEVALHSVPLTIWWDACGFAKIRPFEGHSGKGWTAHIPDSVLHSNDRDVYAGFLRGLFEADGKANHGYASWATTNEELSRDVQTLMLALGFVTTRGMDGSRSKWGAPCHRIRLLNAATGMRFAEQVGFMSSRKNQALIEAEHPQAARHDRIPITRELVDELAPQNDSLRKTMLLSLSRTGAVSRRSADALLERTPSVELEQILGYFYDEVSTIELLEDQPTFDLSVPDNVTYVANGFVSHNTISFLMDCDTTGVEPDFSLVKFKELVGGGQMTIVNQTIPMALRTLGYSEEQIEQIEAHVDEHATIVGAPGLAGEHLSVFDVAVGERAISHLGHIKMMGAVQPFISGAISKCVAGDTLVASERGLVRIGALHNGERPDSFRDMELTIASLDGPRRTDAFYYGGARPVREVRLRSGHKIVGTENHRLLTCGQGGLVWRRLDELRPGEYVATQYGDDMWAATPASFADFVAAQPDGNQKQVTVPAAMTERLAFFLGAYAADGQLARTHHTVRIANADETVISRLVADAEILFGFTPRVSRQPGRCPSVDLSSKRLVEFLDHLGCGARASDKRVPDAVLRSPRSMVLAFLEGLCLDAYLTTAGMSRWAICLDSSQLLDDLQAVLTNLGVVHSRISKHDAKYHKSLDEVYCCGREAQRLIAIIGFVEGHKQRAANKILARRFAQSSTDVIPGITGVELYELLPTGRGGRGSASTSVRPRHRHLVDPRTRHVSRESVARLAELPGVELPDWLDDVLERNLHFSQVAAVADVAAREVYDVSVPVTHAFVANGIVNHNTVNLPHEATVEDIADAYLQAWHCGVKALAIYRDGSKTAQALRTDAHEGKDVGAVSGAGYTQEQVDELIAEAVEAARATTLAEAGPKRNRMPCERQSITHKFSIAGHEGYITAGMYEDGTLGEIFLTDIGKEGSTLRGLLNSFATSISMALQYGVPLEKLVEKFSYMRFEPEGITQNPEIPFAKSMPDYIMRWLASRFLDTDVQEELGILTPEVRARKMAEDAGSSFSSSDAPGPANGSGRAAKSSDGNGGASARAKPAKPTGPLPTVAGTRPATTRAAAEALTDTPPVVPARMRGLDLGPACSQCGGMMQRTGSCYTCSSCGNNTGCG